MSQIFLSRDSAVQLLMYGKRKPVSETIQKESLDSGTHQAAAVPDIGQLVLDVKAGHLRVFDLSEPDGTILRVYVS
jgi:hypothetical protein